jgi:hypothetical protein
LRELAAARDRAGAALLAVLVALAVPMWLLPVVPGLQRAALARYHLALPFPVWAARQLCPAMYNFANLARVERDGQRATLTWVNHHPARVVFEPR